MIDNYQTTTHVPEALHRLVEAYTALGVIDEARKVAAVLGHNYPGSDWYLDTYAVATGSDLREKAEERDSSAAHGTGCFKPRCWRRFPFGISS